MMRPKEEFNAIHTRFRALVAAKWKELLNAVFGKSAIFPSLFHLKVTIKNGKLTASTLRTHYSQAAAIRIGRRRNTQTRTIHLTAMIIDHNFPSQRCRVDYFVDLFKLNESARFFLAVFVCMCVCSFNCVVMRHKRKDLNVKWREMMLLSQGVRSIFLYFGRMQSISVSFTFELITLCLLSNRRPHTHSYICWLEMHAFVPKKFEFQWMVVLRYATRLLCTPTAK